MSHSDLGIRKSCSSDQFSLENIWSDYAINGRPGNQGLRRRSLTFGGCLDQEYSNERLTGSLHLTLTFRGILTFVGVTSSLPFLQSGFELSVRYIS